MDMKETQTRKMAVVKCALCGKELECDDMVKDAKITHFECSFKAAKQTRERVSGKPPA